MGKFNQEVNYILIEDLEVITHTEAAVFIAWEGYKVWVPKSQIEDTRDISTGSTIDLHIAEWICREKGFI